MREIMARLTPRFSATRTVRENTKQHYLPAAAAFCERASDKGAVGRQMANWRQTLEQKWPTLRFGDVRVETRDRQHLINVQVFFNELDPPHRAASVQFDCVLDPTSSGLFGASDTALQGRCDSAERRTNPVAAMIRFTKVRKMKKTTPE